MRPLVLAASVLCLFGCKKEERPLNPQPPVTLPGGVVVQVNRPGDGDVAKKGDKITIHFTGTLLDGGVFDSSRERGRPFQFWVGERQIVEGLDDALLGRREGELLVVTVPPALGYGRNEKPKIPANSTLVFDVELLDVR